MFEFLAGIDADIVISFNNASHFLNRNFWSLITREIYAAPVVLLLAFLALKSCPRREAFLIVVKILLVLMFCSLSTEFSKLGFERPRPLNDPELINMLNIVIEASSFSFWSGHTAVSFCLAFSMWYFTKSRWSMALFVWAGLFSVSRLFLAAHYLSDILTGFLVGWFFALVGFKLLSRIKQKPSAFSTQH